MQATFTESNTNAELATLGPRLTAFALDVLLLLTLIGLADYFTISTDENALFLKPERLLHLVLGWLYFAGGETCYCQATPGKYLLHLRVTTTRGSRPSFRATTIRFFARPFSVLLFTLRFLVSAPSDTRSMFHDRLANSQVVKN
ncbi:RDD family protein [Pontibacter akesuensis]|uniref:Uncharacterized membrane protein YckC, RDD family n=1 Tax=Pontibacter akesuensis TaxID=388950 RepID=A0A1I7JWC9_9BACT|nr:RDD family protein [Pontibacter akesuensis]GHA77144.1 hypothetical protein GCM10007389_33960 [Pontibacter akesuensis]SFU89502.1 Uncharacterized membrane protein YckC, RDD family [Pontibacter akesuensis]